VPVGLVDVDAVVAGWRTNRAAVLERLAAGTANGRHRRPDGAAQPMVAAAPLTGKAAVPLANVRTRIEQRRPPREP